MSVDYVCAAIKDHPRQAFEAPPAQLTTAPFNCPETAGRDCTGS